MSYIMEYKTEIENAAWASASRSVYTVHSSLEDGCKYPVLMVYDMTGKAYDWFVQLINESVPNNKFLVVPVDKKLGEDAIVLVERGTWVYADRK